MWRCAVRSGPGGLPAPLPLWRRALPRSPRSGLSGRARGGAARSVRGAAAVARAGPLRGRSPAPRSPRCRARLSRRSFPSSLPSAGRGAGRERAPLRTPDSLRAPPSAALCVSRPCEEKQAAAALGRVVGIYPFVYITISSIFLPSKQQAFRHLGQIFIPKSDRLF